MCTFSVLREKFFILLLQIVLNIMLTKSMFLLHREIKQLDNILYTYPTAIHKLFLHLMCMIVCMCRSFVPPVRDEESETQRKAHAKRVRETRRSTQGVTLDEIKSAEQLVKKKQQNNESPVLTPSTQVKSKIVSSMILSPIIISLYIIILSCA